MAGTSGLCMWKDWPVIDARAISTGSMPKLAMAHNFVLLKKGVDAQAVATASAMARATEYFAPAQRIRNDFNHAGLTVSKNVTVP